MQSINAGFQNLKALIPHSSGEKLSKACILQRSADYMQYLSNEKDKITNKLQIAIRLIESNGLLAQLQTQINMSLAEGNSSNQSNSTSTTTSAAAAKANRLQQKQNMAALATASTDTSCSSQNQSTDINTNITNNNTNEKSSTKIANISATPASVASNRKSISSSVSFYASPDRNDIKLEQQQQTLPPPPSQTPSIPLPPLETTPPSSLTNITSNPLSSIINLKGKNINNTNNQIEPIKINTTSPNNNKVASSAVAETTYLTSIDNDQNKFTIKSNLLSNGDDLSSNTTTLNEKNNTPTILTSSPNTNMICRQLSDTTNIISFSDNNNLIVLNSNSNSNNTLNANSNIINNMQVTNLSQQHGNNQLQLNLNPNETTSCSFNSNTTTNGSDLKGNNNSNLFSCGPTLIQSLNPIGSLASLQQHSQILSSSSGPNNNEQNNAATNASTITNNINSKQLQLEFDNSKKISNLLRCTDLFASSSSLSSSLGGNNLNKKHIKQMVQMEQPTLVTQPLSNQINQVTEQELQQMGMSHIQISNVDLVKLIEYKVKSVEFLFLL